MTLFNVDTAKVLDSFRFGFLQARGWYVRNDSALTNHFNHVTVNVFPAHQKNAYWVFVKGRYLDIKQLITQEDEYYFYINEWYENKLAKPREFKDVENEWNWLTKCGLS